MNIRDVTVDKTGSLADTLRIVFGDCPKQIQAQRRENVNEAVVGSELEDRLWLFLVEVVNVICLDELQGVVAELFSVTDGDV